MGRAPDRLVPPGFDGRREFVRCLAVLAGAAALTVLLFGMAYFSARLNMYVFDAILGARVEDPDAEFGTFGGMIAPGAFAFLAALVFYLWLLFRFISYHYKGGTRCAYTMKRLPKRFDFQLRCAALPVSGILLSQLIYRALALLLGWLYVSCTPERWLPPGSWESVIYFVTH